MSQNIRNQGFSYYFCLMIEGSGPDPYILTPYLRIRILEAQKHTECLDPTGPDLALVPDPQHCMVKGFADSC